MQANGSTSSIPAAAGSATHFAWSIVGAGQPYEPPVPRKRGTQRYAAGATCWLCGGPTHGVGWPRDLALPSTFASHNEARDQLSDAVCQPCAALAGGETWQTYVATHPELGLKVWGTASWRSYGHFFHAGGHRCPKPAEWREILLVPPDPPFLAIISLTGQKNLIFRGAVAHTRDGFPVQVEESRVYVDAAEFRECMSAFEALLELGFFRDAVLTGAYQQAQVLKVGLPVWRAAEDRMAPWRCRAPRLMTLCHYVARSPGRPEQPSGDVP